MLFAARTAAQGPAHPSTVDTPALTQWCCACRAQAFQQHQIEAAHRAGLMAAASGLGAARPGGQAGAKTPLSNPPPVRHALWAPNHCDALHVVTFKSWASELARTQRKQPSAVNSNQWWLQKACSQTWLGREVQHLTAWGGCTGCPGSGKWAPRHDASPGAADAWSAAALCADAAARHAATAAVRVQAWRISAAWGRRWPRPARKQPTGKRGTGAALAPLFSLQ